MPAVASSADAFSEWLPHGAPRIATLRETQGSLAVHQRYRGPMSQAFPISYGSPHYIHTQTYAGDISSPTALAGGLGEITVEFRQIPPTHTEYETITYTFPGFSDNDNFRYPYSSSVTARVVYTYHFVSTAADAPSSAIASPADITTLQRQRFVLTGTTYAENEYVGDGDSESYGGVTVVRVDTTPSLSTYLARIAAGTELLARDTEIVRWFGPIYRARNTYIAYQ